MEPISPQEKFYHEHCCVKLFGDNIEPSFFYAQEEFEELARKNIEAKLIVPGAQRKISASLYRGAKGSSRITVFGDGKLGSFILKPEHPEVPSFPANEHLAMTLSRLAGIPTAECGLLWGPDKRFTYITRRFDRLTENGTVEKVAMEDFGQIFGRVRDADKYKESFNRIGRFLRERSTQPLLDGTQFFNQVFLSYLIGNNDFHLRNISLFTRNNTPKLTPAYDVTITQLIDPEPNQDVTLPVMGKRARLKHADWIEFGATLGLNSKAIENRLLHFEKCLPIFIHAILQSLLPENQKHALEAMIVARLGRAGSLA
jgi:serine/threonine-protein kinase HipA